MSNRFRDTIYCTFILALAFLIPRASFASANDILKSCALAYASVVENSPVLYRFHFGMNKADIPSRPGLDAADKESELAARINNKILNRHSGEVLERMYESLGEHHFINFLGQLQTLPPKEVDVFFTLMRAVDYSSADELERYLERPWPGADSRRRNYLGMLRTAQTMRTKFTHLNVGVGQNLKSGKFKVEFHDKGLIPLSDVKQSRPSYEVLPLQTEHLLERWGISPHQLSQSQRFPVKYLSNKEREQQRVTMFNGRMYGSDLKRLNTFGPVSAIMDKDGNWFVSATSLPVSSLSGGRPVAFAGFIDVKDGLLVSLTRDPLHYVPSTFFLLQAIESLERNSIYRRGRDESAIHWEFPDPLPVGW